MRMVMEAWIDRTREISKLPNIVQVFPFENRGVEVGVTLRHPHGQIYAYSYLTPRTESMLRAAEKYKAANGRVLFDDVVVREIKDKVRIVAENSDWIAFVPYAARYPFEIHIAPKKPVADLTELTSSQVDTFPSIAKEVFTRLDGLFGIEMPYMAGWHQAPVSEGRDLLRLHFQITSVRPAPGKLKYLAGSESMMGAFVMDKSPEQSAEELRSVRIEKAL
jgi:UDPglucose--hexose-1-phosphate uridylyltransferase